jgi:hypothetical protein
MLVITMTDDTTQAGFASDSINFEFGFQVATTCYDTTTDTTARIKDVVDTLPRPLLITLDTMRADSFGVAAQSGYVDPEGDIVVSQTGAVDTSNVDGYAAMFNTFAKPVGHMIRMWTKGLGGKQISSDSTKVMFNLQGTRK